MHVAIAALSRFTSPSGICRHAANLAQSLALRQEIDRVTFISGDWQRYYYDLIAHESPKLEFRTVRIQNSSIARNRWFLYGLPRIVRSMEADILHLSFPLPSPRTPEYKTVVTLHDLYPYDCPEVFGFPNVYFNRMALRRSLANSDAIACVSSTTLERLNQHFSAREQAKAVVIPNSVPESKAETRMPDRWNTPEFVLMVAQHRHNKNLPLAVQSFAVMVKRKLVSRTTALVIVGCSGPETPRLQQQIEALGLSGNVILLQSLQESELQWIYQHCKLFLVTSRYEGFCLPLVEALRAGCNVVCAGLPVLREIGGESCFYFDPATADPGEVTNAASQALTKGNSRTATDLQRFSFEAVGEAYVHLYQSLTGGNVQPARECVRA